MEPLHGLLHGIALRRQARPTKGACSSASCSIWHRSRGASRLEGRPSLHDKLVQLWGRHAELREIDFWEPRIEAKAIPSDSVSADRRRRRSRYCPRPPSVRRVAQFGRLSFAWMPISARCCCTISAVCLCMPYLAVDNAALDSVGHARLGEKLLSPIRIIAPMLA